MAKRILNNEELTAAAVSQLGLILALNDRISSLEQSVLKLPDDPESGVLKKQIQALLSSIRDS